MNEVSIEGLLESAIDEGLFPSCAYLVGEQDRVLESGAMGNAVVTPKSLPAVEATIYDLASLTKVLSTGLLASMLMARKELRPEHRLVAFFPEFLDTSYRDVTVQDIATHSAGFPAWKPFYLFADKEVTPKDSVIQQIADSEPSYPFGKDVVYSDFGFILFGMILEKVLSASLEEGFAELVTKPLDDLDVGFSPEQGELERTAASENGNRFEFETALKLFPQRKVEEDRFRQELIWGEVHDGNCHFLGGVAGHAGLFGTIFGVFRLARQFLRETTELLDSEAIDMFEKNFTSYSELSRSFSFQLATSKGCTAEGVLPNNAFGHLGFAGTMLWVDPKKERTYILLSNRTHDTGLPFPDQAEIRKKFLKTALHRFG